MKKDTFKLTKKEEKLFKAIYTNLIYKKALFKKAYSILKDIYLSQDAIQEAFLILINNISKIDKEPTKRTLNYLLIIIKNVSLKLLKLKNKNNPNQIMLQYFNESESNNDFLIYTLKNTYPKLTNLLILKYIYGYSLKEIAQKTKQSIKKITNYIYRGKNKIKKYLYKQNWFIN